MELDRSETEQAVVLSPRGRLTLTSASRLKQAVDDEVGAGRVRVVLDLGSVDFIDSSGLGAVVSGLKAARQGGGDLRLAAPGDQVRMVLELTNLDRILRPHASVEAALEGWSG